MQVRLPRMAGGSLCGVDFIPSARNSGQLRCPWQVFRLCGINTVDLFLAASNRGQWRCPGAELSFTTTKDTYSYCNYLECIVDTGQPTAFILIDAKHYN